MNRIVIIALLCFAGNLFAQQWKAEGPFYGKSTTQPYLHTMGFVSEVFPHPTDTNAFLMATNSSGIWKTINRGVDWKCVTEKKKLVPGMGVFSIVANPKNENELFAAAGNAAYGFDSYGGELLRSKNWGDSWEIVRSFDSVFNGKSLIKVTYKNNKLYAVGDQEIFVSEDNANSWKSIFHIHNSKPYITNHDQLMVDIEITAEGTLFVSTTHRWGSRGNAWMSTNNGESWKNLEEIEELKGLKKEHVFCVKLALSEDGRLVAGFNYGNKIHLYQSNNQGETFYKKGEIGLTWETGDAKASKFEMEFSLTNPKKLFLGFIEFFEWDSINGLKMLSPSPNFSAHEHDDVRSMKVIEVGGKERVLMGNDGGMSYYYPENKSFESLNGYYLGTLQVYNLAISQFDSNFTMLIGTQDNGTFKYKNEEWNFIAGGDGGGNLLDENAHLQVYFMNSLIVVYQGKLKKYFSPNNRYSSWYLDSPIEVSPADSILLYGSKKNGGQEGARIYFQNIKKGRQSEGVVILGMTQIGEIAVSNRNPNKVWIAEGEHLDKNDNSPRLMKTINKGESFFDLTDALVYPDANIDIANRKKDTLTLREILSYRTITDIEVDPHDDDIVYVSLSGFFKPESWSKSWEFYRVLKSEDGGESWYDYSYGLPVTPIHCLLRDERVEEGLICGGDEGVYWKRNKNYNWEIFDGNFPKNTIVSDLKLSYCQERLYVSTYGRGVWSLGFPEKHKGINFGGHGTEISEVFFNDDSINSYRFIKKDFIIVKRGKTLTITSDILLSPGATIILTPKSKLILDGGSISSACNEKWNGKIDIIEQRFLWIFKRKKGEVILKNGGKINK